MGSSTVIDDGGRHTALSQGLVDDSEAQAMIARAGRAGEVFSMLLLLMFFERLIEDRMAPRPPITRGARRWPTTGRRPQPRSASYSTVLGSAAAVWSVG